MIIETLVAGALLLGSPTDSTRARLYPAVTCQTITAVVTAAADYVRPAIKGLRIRAKGVSDGDLPGDASFDIVKPYVGHELDVVLHVTSARGDFIARGKASTVADTTSGATHAIRSKAGVVTGTGAFAESSGGITGTGRVNVHTRELELKVTGVVCARWPRSESGS